MRLKPGAEWGGGGRLGNGGGGVSPTPLPAVTMPSSPRILVVAGEASGDDHAARLVAAIRECCPRAEFLGVGGEEMRAQGVRILTSAADLAVVGLMEVAGHLPAIWQALKGIARVLKTAPPELVILVDFPDFNFWVARLAKYYRVPVLYYISPQVWAWRTYRVRTLARLTQRLVVIFPFEADFYREQGVAVSYVGHPFRETLPPLTDRRTFLMGHNLDPEALTIALLPGSRAGEIERHLPIMLKAASHIRQAIPQTQFILPLASTAPAGLVDGMVREFLREGAMGRRPLPPPPNPLPQPPYRGVGEGFEGRAGELTYEKSPGLSLKIIPGQAYQALGAAHAAVVASGTATVEAALAATPTVIVYRVSPLTFAVGRRLVRVEHVGMANLLAGERLFPELIQDEFTPERLAREVLTLIQAPERLTAIRRGLATVIRRLGGPGASLRAAKVAVELMGSRAEK
jgi:lipid-A-disaccharide synthase